MILEWNEGLPIPSDDHQSMGSSSGHDKEWANQRQMMVLNCIFIF